MCTFCSFKCCFVFFNVLFLASGIGLIAVGVRQHSTYSQMGEFAGNSLSKISIVLIAVGATITLVSVLGHLGAFFNHYDMMATFICTLIVIIILELLTGAAFYVFRSRTFLLKGAKGVVEYDLKAMKVIQEYTPDKRHAIDKVQEKFKCCGALGPSDWSTSTGWEDHESVPDSCCVQRSHDCGKDKNNVRTKGCIKAIKLFLLKNLVWVGALCITLGLTEVLGVIAGVCFCMNIKRKNYENMS